LVGNKINQPSDVKMRKKEQKKKTKQCTTSGRSTTWRLVTPQLAAVANQKLAIAGWLLTVMAGRRPGDHRLSLAIAYCFALPGSISIKGACFGTF